MARIGRLPASAAGSASLTRLLMLGNLKGCAVLKLFLTAGSKGAVATPAPKAANTDSEARKQTTKVLEGTQPHLETSPFLGLWLFGIMVSKLRRSSPRGVRKMCSSWTSVFRLGGGTLSSCLMTLASSSALLLLTSRWRSSRWRSSRWRLWLRPVAVVTTDSSS